MADITAAGTTSYPSSIDTRSSIQDGVTQRLAAQINGPAAATLAIEGELGTSPSGTAGTVRTRLDAAQNSDGTIKSSVVTGPQVSYASGVFTISSSLAGQCRLARTSNTVLTMSRYNGSYVLINNVSQQIPSAGVAITNASLSALTVYYVYVYMNSTTMTLELSTTGHATDTTSGVEIKSGDATRTLVGMIHTGGASEFLDAAATRYVLNWYNRRALSGLSNYTANRSTTSATYVEPSSEIRVSFLTWGDESVDVFFSGIVSVSTSAERGQVSLAFDGTTAEDTMVACQSSTALYPTHVRVCSTIAEGKHYATVVGNVTAAATLLFSIVSNTAGNRATLSVATRG